MSSSGKFIRAVLLTVLVAGILDLTIGVMGYYVMVTGHLPENIPTYMKNVLRYIASAAFGKGRRSVKVAWNWPVFSSTSSLQYHSPGSIS